MTLALAVAGATLVLAGGTVVDGYGNAPIADGVVVIENDRILAVGGAGQVVVPPGAEVVSTEGMTVLPGLWDMQVNLMRLGHGDEKRWNETYGPLAERVVMPIAARQLLHAGVTSARDAAAPLDAAVRVKGRIREHILQGPTLYVSGPVLRKLAPAGTQMWQWEIDGADDARTEVRRLADAGVDYVLLAELELWSAEELDAAVSEARIRGLPVHAYAERPEDIVRGAAAQFDGFLGIGGGTDAFPAEVTQSLAGRISQAGARPVAWTPAISALLNL
jgi:cytosine/adenosine deaminase-related metal-dependent hydrolase